VTSDLDIRAAAGQVGEYRADEAERRVLSRRIVGHSGLEVFSAHQRSTARLFPWARPGQGEVAKVT